MRTKTWYEVLLLLSVLAMAFSCSCEPETTKSKFCNRDFGAVVRIIGEAGTVGISQRYHIHTHRFYYRKGGLFPFLVQNRLYTGIHSGVCGINFQPGAFYAVSGRYRRAGFLRFLQTISCDYWVKIPPFLVDIFNPFVC